ncbi:hypothetical protein [Streptomyces lacrimifluminis]|uniref:hypothetical protein n=1 Tax=Streptomyces lacrimifluminis TaxID=1500077 RepID=UPI0016630AAA|nr:hypothetical protein [Streptomyces lacrimifluminis]
MARAPEMSPRQHCHTASAVTGWAWLSEGTSSARAENVTVRMWSAAGLRGLSA